jgi:hypothetical protein
LLHHLSIFSNAAAGSCNIIEHWKVHHIRDLGDHLSYDFLVFCQTYQNQLETYDVLVKAAGYIQIIRRTARQRCRSINIESRRARVPAAALQLLCGAMVAGLMVVVSWE